MTYSQTLDRSGVTLAKMGSPRTLENIGGYASKKCHFLGALSVPEICSISLKLQESRKSRFIDEITRNPRALFRRCSGLGLGTDQPSQQLHTHRSFSESSYQSLSSILSLPIWISARTRFIGEDYAPILVDGERLPGFEFEPDVPVTRLVVDLETGDALGSGVWLENPHSSRTAFGSQSASVWRTNRMPVHTGEAVLSLNRGYARPPNSFFQNSRKCWRRRRRQQDQSLT